MSTDAPESKNDPVITRVELPEALLSIAKLETSAPLFIFNDVITGGVSSAFHSVPL